MNEDTPSLLPPHILKVIQISKGREISVLKGARISTLDKPDALHLNCSTYRETDSTEHGIRVAKGAVEQVIGGALTWEDYDKIAAALLDKHVVDEKLANAAREYQALVRNGQPTLYTTSWLTLLSGFVLHPMQEVVLLALRANATTDRESMPPQPFETP